MAYAHRIRYLLLLVMILIGLSCFAAPNAAVSGRISDATTGLSVAGAVVQVIKGNQVRGSDITDSSGNYEITGQNPGSSVLRIIATGYQIAAVGVKLKNNTTVTENVTISPTTGTLAGSVIDANTLVGINAATVNVYQGIILYTSAITDSNGNYSIPNIAPGNYFVTAGAAGYRTMAQGASISAGETTTASFALAATPGTVAGTITDAVTTNPIAQATVYITDGSVLLGFADTDNNGNYTIPQLAPGSYIAIAFADGYRFAVVGVSVSAGVTTTLDFALSSNPGSIAGRVINSINGLPLQGATINLYLGSALVATLLTNSNGEYEAVDLQPGQYTVVASASNFQTALQGATVSSNTITTADFALLPSPGTVAGTVRNQATSNPIAGAAIVVVDGPVIIASTLTDPNGHYALTGLAPGSYSISASSSGFQTATLPLTISSGGITVQNFSLLPNPGAIAGTVIDAGTLSPISSAAVLVFSGTTLISYAITDDNGAYTIPDLAPGVYRVAAGAASYSISVAEASVASNATTTVNFQLEQPPGTLSGTIISRCGNEPVPGALVIVLSGGSFVSYGVTDQEGHYIVEQLAAGSYAILVLKSNFVIGSASTAITSNTTTTLDFTMTPIPLPPQTIAGEVVINKFLASKERLHAVSWTASPSDCVNNYQVFQNGALVATVLPGNSFVYYAAAPNKQQTSTYAVRAVNSFGQMSSFVSVTLK